MENWFETWFNSRYYHILYQNRDMDEAADFIEKLVGYLNEAKGSKVLDLACGKGRHSLQLKKLGFDVVGVDLAEDSIEEARKHKTDGLEFFVHDMRELYWSGYFDIIVNLFTSFGYFHSKEDDQQTISSAAHALKPGGKLIIDFMNANKVVKNLVASESKEIDGVQFKIRRFVQSGIITKQIKVIDGDIELDFEEQVDALMINDFSEYLQNAGLELKATFGDYQLSHFDSERSDRLIIVAQKPSV